MLCDCGTVEVQGFRCFVHGDDETLFDDVVANWASISGSRGVMSGEILAESVKDIFDVGLDGQPLSAFPE